MSYLESIIWVLLWPALIIASYQLIRFLLKKINLF